jgi:hypothetical protein
MRPLLGIRRLAGSLSATVLLTVPGSHAAEAVLPLHPGARVSEARPGRHGFVVHDVECEFQSGRTELHVMLPDKRPAGVTFPVLYLLPVEATNGVTWGSALAEAKRLDLANQLGVVCVYPTFSQLPWFVDHATEARVRQESYFVKVVVPAIEARHPVRRERDARLLLGFSKSGWGACSLLLRHPDVFGKAAAWDAPTAMDAPRHGIEVISGTRENYERHKLHTALRGRGGELGTTPRLGLFGYGNFREQMTQTHELMRSLGIPHEWRDGPQRKHHWESGWVEDAARWLVK